MNSRAKTTPVPAVVTPVVSRIASITIRPNNYRPPREADPPSPRDARLSAAFLQARFSLYVTYEIQARCCRVPLTAHENRSRDRRRDLCDADYPRPLVDALHAAADRLLDRLPCSHCMAREECPGRGRA